MRPRAPLEIRGIEAEELRFPSPTRNSWPDSRRRPAPHRQRASRYVETAVSSDRERLSPARAPHATPSGASASTLRRNHGSITPVTREQIITARAGKQHLDAVFASQSADMRTLSGAGSASGSSSCATIPSRSSAIRPASIATTSSFTPRCAATRRAYGRSSVIPSASPPTDSMLKQRISGADSARTQRGRSNRDRPKGRHLPAHRQRAVAARHSGDGRPFLAHRRLIESALLRERPEAHTRPIAER